MRIANPRVALAAAAALWAGMAVAQGVQYRVHIDGLACPFCAFGIEKQLLALEGVDNAETHIDAGAVLVTMDEGRLLTETKAARAVRAAGFTLKRFEQVEP